MIVHGSEFVPAPDGVHNAVCVDVADLGIVDGTFGPKHMLKVVWEIEEKMETGKRFIVQKRYSVSLHEKSNLFKDLKSWRGKPFTSDELKAFDMEKVVGVPCQVVVVHSEKEGAVYANVQTVIKAGATRLTPSGQYTRLKDRPDYQPPGSKAAGNGATHKETPQEVEADIPF